MDDLFICWVQSRLIYANKFYNVMIGSRRRGGGMEVGSERKPVSKSKVEEEL